MVTRRLGTLILASGLAVAACGSPTSFGSSVGLAVENRTNSQLALTSDLRIEPCGEATFTREQVVLAHQEQRIIAFLGPDEVAGGLIALSLPADIAEEAATGGPVIAVVTANGTQFSTGSLDRSALPACAGTARQD